MATFGTVRQIFYAIFLTDVVGLEPRLASVAALVGILWDAINDPLVGTLSDKISTRWGRRRPFLLFFSIPFGLSFVALWWAPPFESTALVAVTVTLAYMLSDTLQTLVTVPFFALTPEMTEDYDERTSLTSYRMFFNLVASLAAAVGAPMIVDNLMATGATQQQGYLVMGALFGGLAALPFLVIFALVRERVRPVETVEYTFKQTAQTAWRNVPFRYATALYMLNWITFDLVGLMLPFFVVYWVSQGNLIAMADLFGMTISLESVIFGFMLITAVISLAAMDFSGAQVLQAHRLHDRHVVLGGGAVLCLFRDARAADVSDRAGGSDGALGFDRPRAARRYFPRCDRVGRVAHWRAARGDVLWRQELYSQANWRRCHFRGFAGAGLARLSGAASGSHRLDSAFSGNYCYSGDDWAYGRGAADRRHRSVLLLSADAHPTPAHAGLAGTSEETLGQAGGQSGQKCARVPPLGRPPHSRRRSDERRLFMWLPGDPWRGRLTPRPRLHLGPIPGHVDAYTLDPRLFRGKGHQVTL